MRILAGLAVMAVLFAAGFFTGRWWQGQGSELAEQAVALPPVTPTQAPKSLAIDRAAAAHQKFADTLRSRNWDQLVDLLEEARTTGQTAQYETLYEGMRAVAADLVAAEAPAEAATLLARFAALNPQDYEIRFQLADAWLDAEEPAAALNPILEILAAPLTVDVAERAAEQRELIAARERERLMAAGDVQGLVALQERLLEAEPASEAQRLALAAAQIEAGALDAAEETLTLAAGYDPEALAKLKERLDAERSELVIDRSGRELFATVSALEQRFRLLVDTGATQSALVADALLRVAAERTGERRSVLTAAGPMIAEVYRIPELQVAGRRFIDLEVLELPSAPVDADGLLGLDVLAQLGEVGLLPIGSH